MRQSILYSFLVIQVFGAVLTDSMEWHIEQLGPGLSDKAWAMHTAGWKGWEEIQ